MDAWVDGWMGGWVDGWMGGWVDGWMDGWMGRWVDGWTLGTVLQLGVQAPRSDRGIGKADQLPWQGSRSSLEEGLGLVPQLQKRQLKGNGELLPSYPRGVQCGSGK